MSKYQTNEDKIFQAVIKDDQLVSSYGYNSDDFSSVTEALSSDVAVVRAVALIIRREEEGKSEDMIYKEVFNHLSSSI